LAAGANAVSVRCASACRWTPSLALAPPTTTAVITPLATLALAASRDPAVLAELKLSTQEAIGSRDVLSYVFKKYGYDEAALDMDLLTFTNATIARPAFAAFYGTNVQLAGLSSILTAALTPVLPKPSPIATRHLLETPTLDPAKALSEALAINIFKHLPVTAATSLIDTGNKDAMLDLMFDAYTEVSAKIGGVAPVEFAKLAKLAGAVAEVSGGAGKARQSTSCASSWHHSPW
jgi:hypothetical protein